MWTAEEIEDLITFSRNPPLRPTEKEEETIHRAATTIRNQQEALIGVLRFARDNKDRADAALTGSIATLNEKQAAYSVRRAQPIDVENAVSYNRHCAARSHEAGRIFCAIAHRVGEAMIPDFYGKEFMSSEGTYIGRKKGIAQYSANEVANRLLNKAG